MQQRPLRRHECKVVITKIALPSASQPVLLLPFGCASSRQRSQGPAPRPEARAGLGGQAKDRNPMNVTAKTLKTVVNARDTRFWVKDLRGSGLR